jgi:hypothetical protein
MAPGLLKQEFAPLIQSAGLPIAGAGWSLGGVDEAKPTVSNAYEHLTASK